jgi:hypothetical protein
MIWSEAVQIRPRNPRSGKASHSPGRVSCAGRGGLRLRAWWVTSVVRRISPLMACFWFCGRTRGGSRPRPAAAAPCLYSPYPSSWVSAASSPGASVLGVFFWIFGGFRHFPPRLTGGESSTGRGKPLFFPLLPDSRKFVCSVLWRSWPGQKPSFWRGQVRRRTPPPDPHPNKKSNTAPCGQQPPGDKLGLASKP